MSFLLFCIKKLAPSRLEYEGAGCIILAKICQAAAATTMLFSLFSLRLKPSPALTPALSAAGAPVTFRAQAAVTLPSTLMAAA